MNPIVREPDNHTKRPDDDVKLKDSSNDTVQANEPRTGDREPEFTPNFNDDEVINKNSSDCKNQPTDKRPDEKAAIIGRVVNERMPQAYAATLLGRNIRTVQRMVDTYRAEGAAGLAHGLCGRPSNNSRLALQKDVAITLIRDKYPGAGPTLGRDMLMERHGLKVSAETLRRWMTEAGLWEPKDAKVTKRRRRRRRSCLGELVQLDTSEHRWLEHAPEMTLDLIIAKDDAAGRDFGRFYTTDSTLTNMDLMRRYIDTYGRPMGFYLDRASHFKVNREIIAKSDSEWKTFITQIERAMQELGIDLIHARSPEGKGRVEREFRTLQDRLIKCMKWDNIRTLEEANEYLPHFLERHNGRYMVVPAHPFDLHRPTTGLDLDSIFSIQSSRKVSNDQVIRFKSQFYQLLDDGTGPNLRAKNVTVEERLDGTIKVRYAGRYYNYIILPHK